MNNQQAATRLLSDIRRVGGSSTLMPYQADAVRELIQEINTLYNGIERRSQEAPSSAGLSLVQRSILRRQRRCLVVYHSVRCDRVEGLRWTTGAVLPPGATRENLCSSEVDYFKAYSAAVSNYLDLCGLDLTASLKPPKLDRIPVVALSDCGIVQTASGPRNVSKGETHFMSRSESEPLIRQGLLAQVHW